MARAGVLIIAAMKEQKIGNLTLAKARVAELNGSLSPEQQNKKVKTLRRQIQKWQTGSIENGHQPADCLEPQNAEWVSRHLHIPYEDLVCRDLTPDEVLLRKAERLEKQARQIRDQIAGSGR